MKIISHTFYALFVIALIAVVGVFMATLVPVPGGVEVKIVKSGSMEPAIPTGSLVLIAPAQSYVVGDVVTFGEDTKSEIPTTHRVVSIAGDTFTTKGDANEEADQQPVMRNEIIGKVWLHVPYAGFLLDFARQPLGFALLIGVPAVIIILDELINIFSEVKRLRRRKDKTEKIRFADIKFTHRTVTLPKRSTGIGNTVMFLGATVLSASVFMGTIGGTFSYLRDMEVSTGNILGAGAWTQILPEIELSIMTLSVEEPVGDVMGTTTEATPEIIPEPEPEPEPVVEISDEPPVIEESPTEETTPEEEHQETAPEETQG